MKLTRSGRVKISVRCLKSTGRCKGRLTLKSRAKLRVRRGAKRKKLTIGSRKVSLKAGKTTKVRVKVKGTMLMSD